MAKSPDGRYATVEAMLLDLEAVAADREVAATAPATPAQRATPGAGPQAAAPVPASRRLRRALKVLFGLAVVVGVGVGALYATRPDLFRRPAETPLPEPITGEDTGGVAGGGASSSGSISGKAADGGTKNVSRPVAEPERPRVPFTEAKARDLQVRWAARLATSPEIGNSIGMRFRLIPPGVFRAGSPTDEPGHERHESPREATVDRAFHLGTLETTNAQFRKVFSDFPAHAGDEDDAPAVGITFAQAENFCRRLSELAQERAAGRSYRLPTGTEWEWACRAGSAGPFHGDADAVGWTKANAPTGRLRPMRGGLKAANAWGLLDMHGNAAEWVADVPIDLPGRRVYRSGMWLNEPAQCRAATSRSVDPDAGAHLRGTGFRVVCETR
jgi:formylglycine-generating enzyme required for sulfatase activity